MVELDPRSDAPLAGRVLCDDPGPLDKDELGRVAGALSRATMRRVGAGLAAALGIDIESPPRL